MNSIEIPINNDVAVRLYYADGITGFGCYKLKKIEMTIEDNIYMKYEYIGDAITRGDAEQWIKGTFLTSALVDRYADYDILPPSPKLSTDDFSQGQED